MGVLFLVFSFVNSCLSSCLEFFPGNPWSCSLKDQNQRCTPSSRWQATNGTFSIAGVVERKELFHPVNPSDRIMRNQIVAVMSLPLFFLHLTLPFEFVIERTCHASPVAFATFVVKQDSSIGCHVGWLHCRIPTLIHCCQVPNNGELLLGLCPVSEWNPQ